VLESALTRPKSEGNVLVMGYAPSLGKNPADKWIKKESEDLAEYLQVKEVLPDMCNSKFLKELGPSARIIHLACHGEFIQENPLGSYIFLADGPFTARDWAGLRLQADLVTLSACETGVSNIRPGGDPEGLMRAILFAGASSLLTTLWSVKSSTTFQWMLKFYENSWDENGLQIANKADAFRKATLTLRESYSEPYYWAPFMLVGNYL
jgi:CHAT domain-containing protein